MEKRKHEALPQKKSVAKQTCARGPEAMGSHAFTSPHPHHHSPPKLALHTGAKPGCGPWEKEGRDWPESQPHKGRVTQAGQAHRRDVEEEEVLVGAGAQEGRAVWGRFKLSGDVHSLGPDTWLCNLPAGKCPHFSEPPFICL